MMRFLHYTIIFLIFTIATVQTETVCNQLKFPNNRLVCICNSTYCDTVPKLEDSDGNSYQLYTTTCWKLGFTKTTGNFVKQQLGDVATNRIEINRNVQYQTILGFGGAFTDSTGMNFHTLPVTAQHRFLEAYFGNNGIEYSLCRVPMGGTDFSPRLYSYDDHADDVHLDNFELQREDFIYKIPLIRRAYHLREGKPLRLVASVWSAPVWMKTNGKFYGTGRLKPQYYKVWAEYFLKFFRLYYEHTITFWATTTQNEPADGLVPFDLVPINTMGYTPIEMNDWISRYLGPMLKNSEFSEIKIIAFDDNRYALPFLPTLLRDNNTLKYIDGIGIHWYFDEILPDCLLRFAKTDKKDLFLLNTEACNGFLNFTGLMPAVDLGSWERGESYIESILNYLEFGSVGWIDWNMALNRDGGPVNVNNFVDSPIIVDGNVFYKQPMYYAIGHFSKFVIPDSVRVAATISGTYDGVRTVAFIRPDNRTVVVIYNKNPEAVIVDLNDQSVDIRVEIAPCSLNTLIY